MHHLDVAQIIVSSLIHGLVYAFIFKAFHHMGLAGAAIVAAAGIGLIWLVSILTRRR
ncbi:MAG: hypothetical protein KGL42_07140 [Betaproteobacteria bacterium]|nr:hypothetical protein [Betaproteobacteria bacterium]MDE2254023.1 hypothetical protein [Betaproteobacteria bacterium]